jgi:hypothetical protein
MNYKNHAIAMYFNWIASHIKDLNNAFAELEVILAYVAILTDVLRKVSR